MKKVILNQNYLLDFEQNEVTSITDRESKKVEPRLMRLLAILANHNGQVVARDVLIRKIWGNYNSGEKLLTHSISLLRKYFDDQVIHTVSKRGYMLKGRLKKVARRPSIIGVRIRPVYMVYLLLVFFVLKMIIVGHHG